MEYFFDLLVRLMPHRPTLLLGIVLGAALGALFIWLQSPKDGGRFSSPFWPFAVVVLGVVLFTWMHFDLVHEAGSNRILGGFTWTAEADDYILGSPGVSRTEVIAAFNGWANPELVWTSGSLMLARIVATIILALFIGGIIALSHRLPSFLQWLRKLLP